MNELSTLQSRICLSFETSLLGAHFKAYPMFQQGGVNFTAFYTQFRVDLFNKLFNETDKIFP